MKLKELQLDGLTTPISALTPRQGFRNKYISVSRLELFERCPAGFAKRYIERLKSEPSLPLMFGNLCHSPLEDVYEWILNEEYSGLFPREMLTDAYARHWEEMGIGKLVPAGFDVFSEGIDLMRRYVVQNPEVDHFDHLKTEQKFVIKVGDWDFLGYMDRVDRRTVGKKRIIRINDYKTNRVMFSKEDAQSKLQASIYIMAAQELYPWADEIEFTFDMLRHGVKVHTTRTEEELQLARDYVMILAEQSEAGKGGYPEKLNQFCGWCEFRGACPKYQRAMKGEDHQKRLVIAVPENIGEITKEREQCAKLAKMFLGRQRELEKLIKAKFEEDGPVKEGGVIYSWSKVKARGGVSYDHKKLIPFLVSKGLGGEEELRKKLLKIDSTKLTALITAKTKKLEIKGAQKRQLQLEMEAMAKVSYGMRLSTRTDKEATKKNAE